MGSLLADIFVTVKPTVERRELTQRSLWSLIDNTDRTLFRLTVCFDGSADAWFESASNLSKFVNIRPGLFNHFDYTLNSTINEGLGPTINRAVSHIKSINDWYSHPTHGYPDRVAPFLVMCQDDLQYSKNWLPRLTAMFTAFERSHNLGFASGIECVEHPVKQRISSDVVLKDWIRAAQMFGRREYWESLMPIPRFDPETGRVRARPNDGIGSGVDWWLIRNHENSICRTGRTCLVMPGLVQHAGYNKSTWLSRELPESDSDKEKISND